jgi:sugar/nucleoside kinase (ribokinase family)
MEIPPGDLDLLAIGEMVVDFISVEETYDLRDAYTFRKYQGGAPANIARYVAKLGGKSAVIAKTGAGALGQFLKTELTRSGVFTDYLVADQRVQTSVIFITRSKDVADSEAYRSGDYRLEPKEIDEDAIKRSRVIHASCFALSRQPCRSAVERAFQLAQRYGRIVSLDPNYNPAIWPEYQEAQEVLQRLFAYATISKPSLEDAARVFGPGKTPEAYIELFHAWGPKTVVFTMGADGIILSEAGKMTHILARPVDVADATGAGDAFWAGFLMALLDGRPLKKCVFFGREIVERKLATVGPLPERIDREEIYARIRGDATTAIQRDQE